MIEFKVGEHEARLARIDERIKEIEPKIEALNNKFDKDIQAVYRGLKDIELKIEMLNNKFEKDIQAVYRELKSEIYNKK